MHEMQLEDGRIVEFLEDEGELIQFGSGKQGNVYKVRYKDTGKVMALKVYKKTPDISFVNNLRELIKNADLSNNNSFIWPQVMIKSKKVGYVMNAYDDEKYIHYVSIVKNRGLFKKKSLQITTMINIAKSFRDLHSKGYSYQDINDGCIRVDVTNGDVIICDCDNIASYGNNFGIGGTLGYAPPEVLSGKFRPDKYSDYFSMAVLFFEILCFDNPFEGKKRYGRDGVYHSGVQRKVLVDEPVFMFHPTDKSNEPIMPENKIAMTIYPKLPEFIRKLFEKTFTNGIPGDGVTEEEIKQTRQKRTNDKEWIEALNKWLDLYTYCPKCDFWLTAEMDIRTKVIKSLNCPDCKNKISIDRPVMVIYRNNLAERNMICEVGKVVLKNSIMNNGNNAIGLQFIKGKCDGLMGLVNYTGKELNVNYSSGSKSDMKSYNHRQVIPVIKNCTIKIEFDCSRDVYSCTIKW